MTEALAHNAVPGCALSLEAMKHWWATLPRERAGAFSAARPLSRS
jgi:hypothetical protein